MARFRLRRGVHSNLPSSGLLVGEPLFSTDRATLHVATAEDEKVSVVPAVEELASMPSVDGAADLILMHDASETVGRKEKKIPFNAFKTALNIPEGSEDEKVAVVSGGPAGFIWGTDGTDGVLRVGPGISWTKDEGNGFVTFAVDVVDGGTFV